MKFIKPKTIKKKINWNIDVTPAMLLGITENAFTLEDIIYFK